MALGPFSSIPVENKTSTAQLAFQHSHARLLTSFGSFKTVKRCSRSVIRGHLTRNMSFSVPNDGDFFLDPPASSAPSDQTGLLVLVAPLTISTAAYVPLIEAVQECIGDRMRLAGVVMQVDWQAALQGSQMMQQPKDFSHLAEEDVAQNMDRIRAEAASRGWLANDLPSGRNERIFMAGHSAGGQVAEDYALKKTGGLILLASRLTPAGNRWAGMTQHARPIMILGGTLDGQMRWTRNVPWLVESAVCAATEGGLHAAANKPVILLEGVNHAQFGDDQRNAARGDIKAAVSYEEARRKIAQTMADFLVAHLGHGDTPAELTPEAEPLLSLAQSTVSYACSFIEALDAARRHDGSSATPLLQEKPETAVLCRQLYAHPGEIEAAQKFAVAQQRRLLEVLPAEFQERVTVTATVCTDFTTFTYNQPAIVAHPGKGTRKEFVHVRINVRCMLWREHLQGTAVGGPQAAPQYWLKLRQPRLVAWALGLDGEQYDDSVPPITGAQINQHTWGAMKVPQDAAKRYQEHGRRLVFKEDVDVTESAGPEKWIKEERIAFKDIDDHTTEVSSSLILSKAPEKLSCYHKGIGLFRGSVYMKCLSPASMIEWVMLDSLKDPGIE